MHTVQQDLLHTDWQCLQSQQTRSGGSQTAVHKLWTALVCTCSKLKFSTVHVMQTRLNSHSTPQSVDAYRSSPCRAFSMASGSCERNKSCVTTGDPRHRVDRRLITVDMLGLDLESAGDTTTGPKTEHVNILIYK